MSYTICQIIIYLVKRFLGGLLLPYTIGVHAKCTELEEILKVSKFFVFSVQLHNLVPCLPALEPAL